MCDERICLRDQNFKVHDFFQLVRLCLRGDMCPAHFPDWRNYVVVEFQIQP